MPLALNLYGRANRLTRSHLVDAAGRRQVRARAVERMLDRLCDRAEPWLDRLGEIGFDDSATVRLRRLVAGRLAELRG